MTLQSWSRSYRGKQAVREHLLAPLFAQFDGRYTSTASAIMADEDRVVIECTGNVMTVRGIPYNNRYCYVCRMSNGKLIELTEYFDTAPVNSVLAPPSPAQPQQNTGTI